jgi:two-component system cell cycle sensor histidine kinase/response regulator CckA
MSNHFLSGHTIGRKAWEMETRILIVDDEPAILYILDLALRSAGYEVTQASDGQEALEIILKNKAAKEPFDLLLYFNTHSCCHRGLRR